MGRGLCNQGGVFPISCFKWKNPGEGFKFKKKNPGEGFIQGRVFPTATLVILTYLWEQSCILHTLTEPATSK